VFVKSRQVNAIHTESGGSVVGSYGPKGGINGSGSSPDGGTEVFRYWCGHLYGNGNIPDLIRGAFGVSDSHLFMGGHFGAVLRDEPD